MNMCSLVLLERKCGVILHQTVSSSSSYLTTSNQEDLSEDEEYITVEYTFTSAHFYSLTVSGKNRIREKKRETERERGLENASGSTIMKKKVRNNGRSYEIKA